MPPFKSVVVIQSFSQCCLWDETRWENEGGGDRGRSDLFRACGKGVSSSGEQRALLMLPVLISAHRSPQGRPAGR